MAGKAEVQVVIKARDEASGVLKRITTNLTLMNKAGLAIGIGAALSIGALGVAAVKSFASFDESMTRSLAIMGDVSKVLREDMSDAARQVGRTTLFSAKQAADAYFFLASAGLSAASSIKAMPTVAKFAQAGMFDLALATDLLTDAQSALGLTMRNDVIANMQNMNRVSDVLVKANTLANATVEQFSKSLTREAGAAMKSFKIDIEEGVAVLAAFADQGIKGEVAGGGLSRILRLMTAAAVKNAEAYRELGVSVFDSSGNLNNMADIIADLERALIPLSDKARVSALSMLGFKARVQGIILPLLGTSAAIRRYEKELRSAQGITEEVANKQLKTFNAQVTILKSLLEDFLITVGQKIVPVLSRFVSGLIVLTGGLESMGDAQLRAARGMLEFLKALAETVRFVSAAGAVILALTGNLIGAAGLTVAFIASGKAISFVNDKLQEIDNQIRRNSVTGAQELGTAVEDTADDFGDLEKQVAATGGALSISIDPILAARDAINDLHNELRRLLQLPTQESAREDLQLSRLRLRLLDNEVNIEQAKVKRKEKIVGLEEKIAAFEKRRRTAERNLESQPERRRAFEAEISFLDDKISGVRDEIAIVRESRSEAELLSDSIEKQISILERAARARDLERKALEARGLIADRTLETDLDIIVASERLVEIIQEETEAFSTLTDHLWTQFIPALQASAGAGVAVADSVDKIETAVTEMVSSSMDQLALLGPALAAIGGHFFDFSIPFPTNLGGLRPPPGFQFTPGGQLVPINPPPEGLLGTGAAGTPPGPLAPPATLPPPEPEPPDFLLGPGPGQASRFGGQMTVFIETLLVQNSIQDELASLGIVTP